MKYLIKISTVALLVCAALFGTSPSVKAGIVTQTFTYAMSSTDWMHNLNIAQINVTGSLTNVQITETIDWTTYLASTNKDASSSITVKKDKTELQVYDSITGLNVGTDLPIIDNTIGYQNAIGVTLAPNTGHIFGNYFSTNSFIYTYSDAATLPFVGTGWMPFTVETLTQNDTSFSGGGQFDSTWNTMANLNVQVVYDYSGAIVVPSVPEPSAGLLLGVGGLICWGWRRKVALKEWLVF